MDIGSIDIEELKTQLAESAASWMNEVDSRIQAKAAIEQLQAENAKLKSELEEARKDQGRYQFIRDQFSPVGLLIHGIEEGLALESMDAAVDREMTEWLAAGWQQGDDAKG